MLPQTNEGDCCQFTRKKYCTLRQGKSIAHLVQTIDFLSESPSHSEGYDIAYKNITLSVFTIGQILPQQLDFCRLNALQLRPCLDNAH